ncbi:hypothetical protein [Azospirillum sp. sgz302134]
MLRFALSALGSAVAVLLLTASPQTASAENLACQTVNGKTVCSRGQGSLACQTVNDKTTCITGPGTLTCETINDKTTCRRGPAPHDLKPMPMPPMTMPSLPPLPHEAKPTPDQPFGRNFPFEEDARAEPNFLGPDALGGAHGLTVRVGTLVVSID